MSLPVIDADKNAGYSLTDIIAEAEKAKSIIILFAEGTTTNGRGFLHSPVTDILIPSAAERTSLIPSHIKYQPPDVSTPIPPKSVIFYIVSLMCNWRAWSVRLQVGEEVSAALGQASLPRCIDDICMLGRIKKLGSDLDFKSKVDFVTAWQKNRR